MGIKCPNSTETWTDDGINRSFDVEPKARLHACTVQKVWGKHMRDMKKTPEGNQTAKLRNTRHIQISRGLRSEDDNSLMVMERREQRE